ncbi:facilitated trehalose transporter Tret1-2 homolog [Bombyx mandarina]|uniref:Facilitated trehalose transporter Tret1-2 homolog n=1 Tax=Bombyx mandarina TaxID=7092 RepID=A0A6J2JJ03_BOMMA|nr:facilitated trehalose transporter Tret1-2 homolog [Bombyx mandarina]
MTPLYKQSWAVSAVLLNMVGHGMLLSYTTSLLPALQAPDSPIPIDLQTSSWLSSSIGIAGIPGFFISSALMERYGRRIAHFILMVPGLLGWLLIYAGNTVPVLLMGRLLGGMSAGATVSLGAIVIGEYSSPKYRGMFLTLKTASVCLGGMFVHILGHFYDWRTIAMQAMTPYIISLAIIWTWPESPAWLASKQNYEKCEKNFYYLRGNAAEAQRELEDMLQSQMSRASQTTKQLSLRQKLIEFFKKFTKKNFLGPMFILLSSTVLLEASGRHIFPAYALQIISEITGSKSQSYYYTLCIDAIITVSAVCSSILVNVMRRRTLLLSTGLAACSVLMVVCTYLFLVARGFISEDYHFIPIGLFVMYFILANLGCSPIPVALLGELYPLEHRGVGSAVTGVFISLGVNLALLLTPYLLVSIKVYGTFAVFGLVMAFNLTILYFTLPETKDRTLQEIEDYFVDGQFKDNRNIKESQVTVKMLK